MMEDMGDDPESQEPEAEASANPSDEPMATKDAELPGETVEAAAGVASAPSVAEPAVSCIKLTIQVFL